MVGLRGLFFLFECAVHGPVLRVFARWLVADLFALQLSFSCWRVACPTDVDKRDGRVGCVSGQSSSFREFRCVYAQSARSAQELACAGSVVVLPPGEGLHHASSVALPRRLPAGTRSRPSRPFCAEARVVCTPPKRGASLSAHRRKAGAGASDRESHSSCAPAATRQFRVHIFLSVHLLNARRIGQS